MGNFASLNKATIPDAKKPAVPINTSRTIIDYDSTYTDLGCWNDTPSRALPFYHGDDYNQTRCAEKAKLMGHTYFALQYNTECYSGNEGYDKYGRYNGICPLNGTNWCNHVFAVSPLLLDCNDPASQDKCIELNMAKKDFINAQSSYEQLQTPEVLKSKKAKAQTHADSYINNTTERFNQEFEKSIIIMKEDDIFTNNPSLRMANKYKEELLQRYNTLKDSNQTHKESIEKLGRRFVNAFPQKGVNRSLDDKIFILFWICFLLFIVPVLYYTINTLGLKNPNTVLFSSIIAISILIHIVIRHL